jgi:uncharacterized SAM-binding protein YcdF (DUF218 family)
MFVAGKLIWAVLQPGNLLTLCLLAGVILYLLSRGLRGKVLVGFAALGFALLAVAPIGPAMMLVLEERFPRPAKLPGHIDGIMLLGGAVNPAVSLSSGETTFNCSTARVLGAVALARDHPEAKLVMVGGEGGLSPIGYSEARATLGFVVNEGIAPSRLLLEEKSRSTHENAVYAKELLRPAPGQTWVLVTSAYHMPRSVGAFRAAGWQVIPYPVDFDIDPRTGLRPSLDLVDRLSDITLAGKEWVGLVGYRLMGWTQELFPEPTTEAPTG